MTKNNEKKENPLFTKLNTLAKTLMDQVPNDIKGKADAFCKEVAKIVTSEIEQANKKVEAAEKKAEAAEARISEDGKKEHEEEMFIIKDFSSNEGTWPSLYRASDDLKPLFCIRFKKHPEQPVICGAHCAGWKLLNDGNVEMCKGVRKIKRG